MLDLFSLHFSLILINQLLAPFTGLKRVFNQRPHTLILLPLSLYQLPLSLLLLLIPPRL